MSLRDHGRGWQPTERRTNAFDPGGVAQSVGPSIRRFHLRLFTSGLSEAILERHQMTVIGHILVVLGLTAALAGEVMFLAVAFKRDLWWFFGCLFVPLVDIVFLALNLRLTAKPFGIALLGLVLAGLGDYLTGNAWFS